MSDLQCSQLMFYNMISPLAASNDFNYTCTVSKHTETHINDELRAFVVVLVYP